MTFAHLRHITGGSSVFFKHAVPKELALRKEPKISTMLLEILFVSLDSTELENFQEELKAEKMH